MTVTVIQRMCRAFMELPPLTPTDQSMLAAVRELRNWTGDLQPVSAQFQPIKFKDGHSAYVGDVIEKFVEFVIDEHERRSEGDS